MTGLQYLTLKTPPWINRLSLGHGTAATCTRWPPVSKLLGLSLKANVYVCVRVVDYALLYLLYFPRELQCAHRERRPEHLVRRTLAHVARLRSFRHDFSLHLIHRTSFGSVAS